MNKPVLLAGYGVRLAGMADKFVEFADNLGWPVLTTWRGMDLIGEDHPLFFGRPGSVASKYANLIVQNCDYLLAIGARLDLPSVGYSPENFAPKATKIILRENNKTPWMDYAYGVATDEWLDQCRAWKEQSPLPKSWVDELSDIMWHDDVLVMSSSGMACEMICQRFKVKHGQRVILSPGLGAMGAGLPQAVGAAFAFPNRRIVCVEGDGSIQLNISTLETIRQHDLKIKLFVLENWGYASIRNTQKRLGNFLGCDPSCGLTLPDIRKVCEAYGVDVCVIEQDKDEEIHPRLKSTLNPDGTITPGRLEDVE